MNVHVCMIDTARGSEAADSLQYQLYIGQFVIGSISASYSSHQLRHKSQPPPTAPQAGCYGIGVAGWYLSHSGRLQLHPVILA